MYRNIIFALALLVSVSFFAVQSHAVDFSADTVYTAEGHKTTGKIYSKSDRFRMEMTGPQQMISISRMDKKVAWSIFPAQKSYMEMQLDPGMAPKTEIRGEIERKQVGAETIDGHPAKKYLVTYKDGSKTAQIYQWMAMDINFPVKTADINNKWTQEFRNIKVGPQPDNLFELPAGYKKMQIPQMPAGRR